MLLNVLLVFLFRAKDTHNNYSRQEEACDKCSDNCLTKSDQLFSALISLKIIYFFLLSLVDTQTDPNRKFNHDPDLFQAKHTL
jgi:hypothetical protein